jgi:hypothetical protein
LKFALFLTYPGTGSRTYPTPGSFGISIWDTNRVPWVQPVRGQTLRSLGLKSRGFYMFNPARKSRFYLFTPGREPRFIMYILGRKPRFFCLFAVGNPGFICIFLAENSRFYILINGRKPRFLNILWGFYILWEFFTLVSRVFFTDVFLSGFKKMRKNILIYNSKS